MLITDPSGSAWSGAAQADQEKLGVTLIVATIGDGLVDVDGTWARHRGVQEGGAVLVRAVSKVLAR